MENTFNGVRTQEVFGIVERASRTVVLRVRITDLGSVLVVICNALPRIPGHRVFYEGPVIPLRESCVFC